MIIILKDYQFRARWATTLLAFLLLGIFCSLGIWQLVRSDEKHVLLADFQARFHAAPLAWEQLPSDPLNYQPVTLKGRYDNAHGFLLDNKMQEGKVGYQVITPFELESMHTVLVNRGWIPQGNSRQRLPSLVPVEGVVELTGWLWRPTGKAYMLGTTTAESGWPKRIQRIEIDTMEADLARPTAHFLVLLNPEATHGFVRTWQPVAATASYKHLGYAGQWFLFASILLILYIVLNTKKRGP